MGEYISFDFELASHECFLTIQFTVSKLSKNVYRQWIPGLLAHHPKGSW